MFCLLLFLSFTRFPVLELSSGGTSTGNRNLSTKVTTVRHEPIMNGGTEIPNAAQTRIYGGMAGMAACLAMGALL